MRSSFLLCPNFNESRSIFIFSVLIRFHFHWSGAKCTASFLERCISYIGENASECVKTTSFLNLSKEGIIKLISSDYVSIVRIKDQMHSVLTPHWKLFSVLPGRGGCMAMCISVGETQSNCKPTNGTLDGRGALSRLSIFIGGDGTRSIAADWCVYFAF